MPTRRLLLAATHGDISLLAGALDADPALLDVPGPHPFWGGELNLLQMAAEAGQLRTVQFLLARGANPNPDSSRYDHWTPLQIAIHRDHATVAECLIAHGAEVTIWAAAALGRLDAVAVRLSQLHDLGPNNATALHFAATVPVAELLLAHGASLHAVDKYGRTPAAAVANYGARYREAGLYLTAQAGDMDLVRAVALGDLDAVVRLYHPSAAVLPSAAAQGHADVVAFLLQQGADPNAGFPLHNAARFGRVEAARLLLTHGADPALRDDQHHATPIDWAVFHRQPAVAQLLTEWQGSAV